MTREEERQQAARECYDISTMEEQFCFVRGAQWADEHPRKNETPS